MKRILLILILALVGFASKAQVEAVFPYTTPTKDVIQKLASSNTLKGLAYRQEILKALNVGLRDTTYRPTTMEEVFSHLFSEDMELKAGTFINSGYNTKTHQMDESVGHYYNNFLWVFKIGTYTIPLLKADCANVLIVQPIRNELLEFIPTPKEEEQKKIQFEVPKPEIAVPAHFTFTQTPAAKVKNHKWVKWVIGTIAAGGIAYLATKLLNKSKKGSPGGADLTTEEGNPGGAPLTGHRPSLTPIVINTEQLVSLGNPYKDRQVHVGFSFSFGGR